MRATLQRSLLSIFLAIIFFDVSLAASVDNETCQACNSNATISSPTATASGPTSATMGGDITAVGTGGCTITERGVYWSLTPGEPTAMTGTQVADAATGSGVFSFTVPGLPAGSRIYYVAYATNENGTAVSSEQSFYTWASAPGTFPGSFSFTATPNGSQIDLAFTKASLMPMDAHGYLVLRRAGSDPDLSGVSDGSAPGGTYFLADITDSTSTAYVDNSVVAGVQYRYALVPYRVVDDGGIVTSTYNYGNLSSIATATIPLTITIDEINGGIAASPLTSSATTQAILGFSAVSNGTPNFTAINIQVTSSALNKFSSATLYESANNSFGGDAEVPSVSATLTASEIQLSGFSVALSSTAKYFFLVVDVQDTVSASSPTLAASFTNANITISGGGTITVNSSPLTGDTYSFIDGSPPVISSTTPADNATGITVLLTQLTITFNEPVVFVGDNSDSDNRIRIRDVAANAYVDTIQLADVMVAGNVVTLTTDAPFEAGKNYAIRIGNSVFEDGVGNAYPGIPDFTTWNFTIEQAPNITSLSNSTRCIGDVLTINGQRFTGTGGSGNTKPIVTINGNAVDPTLITAYSSTSITLTVPSNASTGDVEVLNTDNNVLSDTEPLTVRPQIRTGLTVTPATLNPAQNTNVDIDIGNASPISDQSQNNYTYALILIGKPGSYTVPLNSTVHSAGGNDGQLTLNTSDGPTPDLNQIGDYQYRIDVSRTGCTTRTLTNTPFTLTVASLQVTVSATDTLVCNGSSTILIGSTSGGTGFYQFSWSGPNGFSSNSSSPTVTPAYPAGAGWYVCTLSDNSANTAKDSVQLYTADVPTAAIIPTPPASTVRTEYVLEDTDFELTGSPAGGVFSGTGVTLQGGIYYFNPQNAGVGTHPITYTYTNMSGCADSDTENFKVSNSAVDGLDLIYCQGTNSDTGLTYNTTAFPATGWQFTRLLVYGYNYGTSSYCFSDANPYAYPVCASNPLTADGSISVPDIQAGVTLPVGTMFSQPTTYTFDVASLRNNYGYSTEDYVTGWYFVIYVMAKNANGVEQAVTGQFFRLVKNGPVPSIVGINELEGICSDADPITLSSSEAGYTIVDFDMFPSTYDPSLSGTTDEIFDPGQGSLPGADERNLQISMEYTDFNNCPNTVYRNFTWVKKPSAPFAIDTAYCKLTNTTIGQQYTIDASPNGSANNPYWYEVDPGSNPGAIILDSINFQGFVAPGIDGLTATSKTFYVTQAYKGCEGAAKTVTITIKEAPNASITNDPPCEDRDFNAYGPVDGGTPYDQYDWGFGDGTVVTIYNNNAVTHNYGPGSGSTSKTISLTITNSEGCTNYDETTITVGLNPKPDFTYRQLCENDDTQFAATTDIAVDTVVWNFGDGTIIGPDTIFHPIHAFAAAGTYLVKATTYTPIGCFNTDSAYVTILPYLTYNTDMPYVMADVNGGDGFWSLEDVSGNSTWEFTTTAPTITDKPILSALGANCWITNATGNYLSGEKGYLNSPCFDIQGVIRPVISIDFAMATQEFADGVVLEWSKDGGLTWQSLGGANSGNNWFNTSNFFSGTIGSSTVGWSDSSLYLADNVTKDTVVQARRALDNIPNLSLAERAKVRFRFVFESNLGREEEGFGFNNVKIESRNRTLLVENFTSMTDDDDNKHTENVAAFNALSPLESVRIQYHLNYPTADANYKIDPEDNSARGTYYGIVLTDATLPRTYIDGYSAGNLTQAWSTAWFNKRALVTSPVLMTIESQPTPEPGYMKAMVTIEALQNIPSAGKPVLHIAAAEKDDTFGNEFVVRKLMSGATGIPLSSVTTLPIASGSIIQVIDSVLIENSGIDVSDLALVAFIQDEDTRNVMQATLELDPVNLPSVIVSAEDPNEFNSIQVYPSPANQSINLTLPKAVNTSTPVRLVDGYGRTVFENYFQVGEFQKTISTSDFAAGVYILQVGTPGGGVARRKVSIVH